MVAANGFHQGLFDEHLDAVNIKTLIVVAVHRLADPTDRSMKGESSPDNCTAAENAEYSCTLGNEIDPLS